jgi:hypothetical protein
LMLLRFERLIVHKNREFTLALFVRHTSKFILDSSGSSAQTGQRVCSKLFIKLHNGKLGHREAVEEYLGCLSGKPSRCRAVL